GWDARKRAYCLKIQPATGSFARNLIYSTKPLRQQKIHISYTIKGLASAIVFAFTISDLFISS
ncbi:hypothetical protein L8O22_13600, partial [Enterobacter roggenkampii]|uniref:hypothetical protein n=1 Tax=Enterobacter roggenkampii TaxID=1812935 RepID=UPI0020037403